MSLPSPSLILANGLEYGFHQSSMPGLVICGLLVFISCWSWAVMLMKLYFIGKARKSNREFLYLFRHGQHPLATFQEGEHYDRSPFYHIYYSAASEMAFQLAGVDSPDKTFATRLQGAGRINPSQMSSVHASIEKAVAEAALRFEGKMSIVAVALSGAPFLGLLGTVWGLMDCFATVAEAEAPTLQMLAPGVCASLLTSLVALLVAVPSLFGYNFLVSRIRVVVARLDNFGAEVASVFDRHYVDHRSSSESLPSLVALGSPNLPAFSGAARPVARHGPAPAV